EVASSDLPPGGMTLCVGINCKIIEATRPRRWAKARATRWLIGRPAFKPAYRINLFKSMPSEAGLPASRKALAKASSETSPDDADGLRAGMPKRSTSPSSPYPSGLYSMSRRLIRALHLADRRLADRSRAEEQVVCHVEMTGDCNVFCLRAEVHFAGGGRKGWARAKRVEPNHAAMRRLTPWRTSLVRKRQARFLGSLSAPATRTMSAIPHWAHGWRPTTSCRTAWRSSRARRSPGSMPSET